MTTLTLIYAADKDGNFTDPATGKCWDVDRAQFREMIADKSIICGRKTFETDWKGLKGAAMITVLTSNYDSVERTVKETGWGGLNTPVVFITEGGICDALDTARDMWRATAKRGETADEIFCIGGKQTIEEFAPFASRLLLSGVGNPADRLAQARQYWIPEYIQRLMIAQISAGRVFWSLHKEERFSFGIRYDWRLPYPIEF